MTNREVIVYSMLRRHSWGIVASTFHQRTVPMLWTGEVVITMRPQVDPGRFESSICVRNLAVTAATNTYIEQKTVLITLCYKYHAYTA